MPGRHPLAGIER